MIGKFRVFWVLLTLVFGAGAQAMTLERVDDTLFATGPLGGDDFLAFRSHLDRAGLRRLVLVDSPGGDLWTALKVGEMVRDAGLDTVAVGKCMSACSVLFVAGKTRAYGTGRKPVVTMLGIHGGYDPETGQQAHGVGPALYAFFRRQIGITMDDGVINEAIYGFRDSRGFLVMPEIQHNPPEVSQARLCLSLTDASTCKRHDGKDAFTLGLVTQRATEALDLPLSMRTQLRYFDEVLSGPAFDLPAWARQMRSLLCPSGDCPEAAKMFRKMAEAPAHKAIAFDPGALGGRRMWVKLIGGAGTPEQATFSALYGCNHEGDVPRLCRVIALDDQDLRPLHDLRDQQAREALGRLADVAPTALNEEKTDFCSGVATQRKPLEQRGYDTAAPCSLRGVERIDTAALVLLLKGERPPVLVDVSPDPRMVPGAFALLGAGVSFADEAKEAAYHQRFAGLVRAAEPDFAQPVVFYGGARAGWLSAHAALRAVQVGYTRVYWYRGGLSAWQSAGLPSVGKVALGVVY